MTRFKLLLSTVILSTAMAGPVFAQAIVSEPRILASNETTSKPWPAPVGHRQPRAIDIPASASHQNLDPEDANVDRKISGICQGC
jgi:hypothetical protein